MSLTDKSFNETYRQSLSSNDLYNIELATNFIKQSSFYNTTLDNTNAFNPDKKQYEDRYIYASKAYDNSDFYKDNLYIKTNPSILDYTKSTMYGLGGFAVGGIEGLADIGNILHPVDAINGLDNAFLSPYPNNQKCKCKHTKISSQFLRANGILKFAKYIFRNLKFFFVKEEEA